MQIKNQIEKVRMNFPELVYDENTNTLQGTLEVFPNDFYTVLIELNPWNTRFPRVYEIGERIPKILDRHIYTNTGNCCFTTPRLEEIYLKTKVKTLVHFINHILIPYLQNNSYYELYQEYVYGEFSHTDATLETYQTVLKIEDRKRIITILYEYYRGNKLTIRDRCYCGSNQTLRKCSKGTHKLGYDQLKYIDKKHMEMDLKILAMEIMEQNKKNRNI